MQQALNYRPKLTKLHKVIEVNQVKWLKPYTDLKIKFRITAKSHFEKDLYKLKKSAAFGKTLEHVNKHGDIKLVTKDYLFIYFLKLITNQLNGFQKSCLRLTKTKVKFACKNKS